MAHITVDREKHLTEGAFPSIMPSGTRNVRARLGHDRIELPVGSYKAGAPTTQLTIDFGLSKTLVLGLLRYAGVNYVGSR